MPIDSALRQPFQAQLAAYRQRTARLVPTARWTDIQRNAHDRAFVVAGAMKAALLQDFADAIDQAVAEGNTLDQFRRQFNEIVARHGWAHTGTARWRASIIYRTNIITSYAAGRLSQLRDPELLKIKPLWMYRHADGIANPRPEHLRWDKTTLPPGHQWWIVFYPPNGWLCHCYVIAVSEEEARALGAKFDVPPVRVDPDTGLPEGIDPGWDYQPGATSELIGRINQQDLAPPLKSALLDDIGRAASRPQTPAGWIEAGLAFRKQLDELLEGVVAPVDIRRRLDDYIDSRVVRGQRARVANRGQAANWTADAGAVYPRSWITAIDSLGSLRARSIPISQGGFQITWPLDRAPISSRLAPFGRIDLNPGDGLIAVSSYPVAIHELAHRIQEAIPDLDAVFAAYHRRRTQGEQVRSILYGRTRIDAQPDDYVDRYQGRVYPDRGALEVMSVAYEWLLDPTGIKTLRMYQHDPDMIALAVYLLTEFVL